MKLKAFAKINLTLEVLGRREDGFHEVKTVMQTIDLADDLVIDPWATIQVDCDDPLLGGEANLVWQAAQILSSRRGAGPGARISIRKRIPVGMGLGGGSADAAAALIGLNLLWETRAGQTGTAADSCGVGLRCLFFLGGRHGPGRRQG